MPLCMLCQRISPWSLQTIRKFEDIIRGDIEIFSPHHKSFTDLEQSGMTCQLCQLFSHEILRRKKHPLRFDAPVILASFILWDLDTNVPGPQLHFINIKCGERIAELHAIAPLVSVQSLFEQRARVMSMQYTSYLHGNAGASLTKRRELALYQHLGSEAATSGVVAGRPLLDRDGQESFNMVRKWMKDCIENHRACSIADDSGSNLTTPESVQLPPRVLDVKAFVGSSLDIRLIESASLEGQYVALSHRWSMDPSKHFKTTTSSIEEHKRRILWEMIPANFQDAVRTTRELGIDYLWIDCLCIIQDDSEDWARQSVMMGQIYHRATITIMAATTPRALANGKPMQSPKGFLHPNSAPDLPIVELPYYSLDGKASGNWYIQPRRVDQQDWELISRGWVLQESILSRRKVIYSPDQIFWECTVNIIQEVSRDVVYKPRTLGNIRQQDQVFLLEWYSHIETYSNCQLTFESDKLPALSGLASYFSQRNKQEYHAGIFSDGIVEGLLWAPERPGSLSRPETTPYIAPSWSWASVNGPIKFKVFSSLELTDPSSQGPRPSSSALGNVIFRLKPLRTNDPHGQLKEGTMELIAILKPAWMRRAREDAIFEKASKDGPDDELLMILHDDSGRLLCTFYVDFIDSAPVLGTRQAVEVIYVMRHEKHVLVLRKVKGTERTYERIAYATFDPEWFEDPKGGSRKEFITVI